MKNKVKTLIYCVLILIIGCCACVSKYNLDKANAYKERVVDYTDSELQVTIDNTKADNVWTSTGTYIDPTLKMDEESGGIISDTAEVDDKYTNIRFDGENFYIETLVIGDGTNNYSYTVNKTGEYSNVENLFVFENGYIGISDTKEAGLYTDGTYYKAVKDDELKTEIVTDNKDETLEISNTEKSVNVKRYYLFNHRIDDTWSKEILMTSDAVRISNGTDYIYIYYLQDDLVMNNNLLDSNLIISKSGTTSNGYNVYYVIDEYKTFELLAKSDADVLEAFKEGAK